ncbi:MAG: gamma-glutamylcyclotransferase [Acidimicrobiales bacterium]|nr:gamma-glutamylcyclotransferase [Acidimicrobiales bacterium]
MTESREPQHLFVYGTLRQGDVRWRFLEPFIEDGGEPDRAAGALFDTGAGYPAAVFEAPHVESSVIIGHRYRLVPDQTAAALATLDEIESAVTGLYQRVTVTTQAGILAWAYQYGLDLDDPELRLSRIASGDWFEHRSRA